jgi:hypothetical protein
LTAKDYRDIITTLSQSRFSMSRKDTFLNITGQIVCGSTIGFIASLVCYLVTYEWVVKILVGNRIEHGFLVGLLTFISFAITYGCGIAGVTEGVRFIGKRFGEEIDWRDTFNGAFLGAPAVVVLILLLNISWDSLTDSLGQNIVSYLLHMFRPFAFIITLPLKVFLKIRFPVELLLILSAAIGAILGDKFSQSTETKLQHSITDGNSVE